MSGAMAYSKQESIENHLDRIKPNNDYEIINGEVHMMSRPSVNHMQIEGNILEAFRKYLKGKTCRPFNETDVFLDDDNNFIPDLIIVCDPEIIEEDGIHGVPDLVVEIVSKSTARLDRTYKLLKYQQYGVKEYWIVDPFSKSVEVYHLKDGNLVSDGYTHTIYEDWEWKRLLDEYKAQYRGEIQVSLYDDFFVSLEDVFYNVK